MIWKISVLPTKIDQILNDILFDIISNFTKLKIMIPLPFKQNARSSQDQTHKPLAIGLQNILIQQSEILTIHPRSQTHQKHSNYSVPMQVPQQSIISYLQRFTKIMKDGNQIQKLASVQDFREDVHANTILRSYFQGALDSIPETVASIDKPGMKRPGILYDMSIDQVLDLINIVAQTPPSFSFSQYSGIPLFSLLIDLMNTNFGGFLFSMPQVNHHLKNIFNDYGNMLKSPKSLEYMNDKEGGWLCKEALARVNYDHFVCNTNEPHFGFKSWNDWFTRQLVPGARPVDGEGDPLVIVNAAESYPLTTLSLPYRNVKAVDKFWLKKNRYSLYDMFQAKNMGVKDIIDESFVGGTVYQGFLSPWCYHCWHSPVDGYIEKVYKIPGCYLQQNPSLDVSGNSNYVDSQAFFSCVSARYIFIIQSNDLRVGRVAIIYIGMAEVSGLFSTVAIGDHVEKGQPIGRFEFGGSSHLIVFDKRANLNFNPKIYDREVKNGFETSTHQPINSWLAKVIPK